MCPDTYRQESLPISTSRSDQKTRQEKQLLFVHTTRIQGTSQLSPSLKSPPGRSSFPKGLELLPSGTIRIGIDYRSESNQNDTSHNRDLRRRQAKTSIDSMHECFEAREKCQSQNILDGTKRSRFALSYGVGVYLKFMVLGKDGNLERSRTRAQESDC